MNPEGIFALYMFGSIFAIALAVLLVILFRQSQTNRIEKVLKFLTDEPKTIQEIAEHLGIQHSEVHDLLNIMMEKYYADIREGKIKRFIIIVSVIVILILLVKTCIYLT